MKVKLILLLIIISSTLLARNAEQIVNLSENLLRNQTSQAKSEMKIIRNNRQKSFIINSWQKGNEKIFATVEDLSKKTITNFLKSDYQLWQYLPSINRTVYFFPYNNTMSFLGSDFTYNDFFNSNFTGNYSAKIILENKQFWEIELIANNPKATWQKIFYKINKQTYLPEEKYFYKQQLVKKLFLRELKRFNKRYYPTVWEMITDDNQKTIIKFSNIYFNPAIDNRIFTYENLQGSKK